MTQGHITIYDWSTTPTTIHPALLKGWTIWPPGRRMICDRWSTSELTLMLQEAGFAAVTCRPTVRGPSGGDRPEILSALSGAEIQPPTRF